MLLLYRQTEKQPGPSPVGSQMLSVNLTTPNINDNGNCIPVHSSQSSPSRRNTGETPFSNVLKKETYTCGKKNSIQEGDAGNKKEKRLPVKEHDDESTLLQSSQTPISNQAKKQTFIRGNKNSIQEGYTGNKTEKRLPVKEHDNESLLLQSSQTPISSEAKKQTSTCGSKDSTGKNDTANKVKEKHDDENPLLKTVIDFTTLKK